MDKKINIGILSVFLIFLSLSLISATTTINSPAASTVVGCGGFVVFNISSTDVYSQGFANITYTAQSTLTANNTWAFVFANYTVNMTNGTAGIVNSTLQNINLTGILEDANNYIFNITIVGSNGTTVGVDTNTGMTVDCTVPTAPTSLTPTSDTSGTNVAFSSTVTGSQTTSCTLFFVGTNPGSTSYAMTHSGNLCTYTLATAPEQTYQYYVRASDESNTTNSATQTLNVDVKTSAGKAAVLIASGQATTNGGAGFSVVGDKLSNLSGSQIGISLLVVSIIVFLIIKYKK